MPILFFEYGQLLQLKKTTKSILKKFHINENNFALFMMLYFY